MKSGLVAVIGKANAGKSTLINVLVGEKVSIVSPKPQTTRERILGVLNEKDYQIIFIDTPGIYKATSKLSDFMATQINSSVQDVDLILYVLDGHREIAESDLELIKKYEKVGVPLIIAYTKIDISQSEKTIEDFAAFKNSGIDAPVIPVSSRKGRNLDDLIAEILKALPKGDKLYSEDIISDKSQKFMIAEIMREKILLKYDKEIPHGVAIIINEFKKRQTGNLYDVNLDIVCERPNHKAILIGKQGGALKEVVSFARKDMEKFLDAKVFLTTFVKVRENWRDRENLLKEFGFKN